eukprot:1194342-Prorocentrum_minimum.AAC.1
MAGSDSNTVESISLARRTVGPMVGNRRQHPLAAYFRPAFQKHSVVTRQSARSSSKPSPRAKNKTQQRQASASLPKMALGVDVRGYGVNVRGYGVNVRGYGGLLSHYQCPCVVERETGATRGSVALVASTACYFRSLRVRRNLTAAAVRTYAMHALGMCWHNEGSL